MKYKVTTAKWHWEQRCSSEGNPCKHRDDDRDGDYRRGYQQGMWAALKYIEDGVDEATIQKWKDAVYNWRFLKTKKKFYPAPEIFYVKDDKS